MGVRTNGLKSKKYKSEERDSQVAVINWLRSQHPNVLFCASAGGLRTSLTQAVNMKRMGYKAGFPDLFIYEPRGGCHGLAIEMKSEKGTVSTEQKAWAIALQQRKYVAVTCYSTTEAIEQITTYLNG